MNLVEQAEIHFHEQEKASIFLESNVSDDAERFCEIALACFYGIRMISNFNDDAVAPGIAVLMQRAPELVEGCAKGEFGSGLKLIDYPGFPGRRSFILKLLMVDRGVKFDLKPKGFGWLARGVGYYGPTSVMALVAKLALKRCKEPVFLGRLGIALSLCSTFHFERQITLTNHANLVFPVLLAVCEEYTNSIDIPA